MRVLFWLAAMSSFAWDEESRLILASLIPFHSTCVIPEERATDDFLDHPPTVSIPLLSSRLIS
jgi:hypothetical protein